MENKYIEKNKEDIQNGKYDSENESWKLIKEIDNLYAISSLGRIMSMRDLRIMKTVVRSGYENAILTDSNNKQIGYLVHRLVATAFIPNVNNYPIINHIDVNPLNNKVDNLEWCSFLYNCLYDNANKKRGEKMRGRTSPQKYKNTKINDGKILFASDDKGITKQYASIGECAKCLSDLLNKKYDNVYCGIWKVIKGVRKSYFGYKFVYK